MQISPVGPPRTRACPRRSGGSGTYCRRDARRRTLPIRGLEERLGLRLLARTTRRVAPTPAGERLLRSVGPRFDEIDAELAALSAMRERPAGTIRITTGEHAADAVLWPAVRRLLPRYPDVTVEIAVDNAFTDIVAERYDAGVRLGTSVAKDMVALRIGPDFRMAVVGAPSYFAGRARPKTPRDLLGHSCINLRLPTYGGVYAWEFAKSGRELRVRVEGQLVFNRVAPMVEAARSPASVSRTCQRTWCRHTSRGDGWSGCWPTGARRRPATTYTTRAAASRRPPSQSWWKRCATRAAQGHESTSAAIDADARRCDMEDPGAMPAARYARVPSRRLRRAGRRRSGRHAGVRDRPVETGSNASGHRSSSEASHSCRSVRRSVSVASPQVAVAVAVNAEPSNAEYVVAPRLQSGVPAVAASHWSNAAAIAASN